MVAPIEVRVDVTDVAGIGQMAETAATVFLPEPEALTDPPVICFAVPGSGYSRRYFSFDMPGSTGGGQAGWHTARGWIFVTIDSLGVGDSTVPEPDTLTYENVCDANVATAREIVTRLGNRSLAPGFPGLADPVTLGIGQSMGGCFTIVAQGQHGVFDGVGILGYSGFHTVVPSDPRGPKTPIPWLPRGSGLENMRVLNRADMAAAGDNAVIDAESMERLSAEGTNPFGWAYHWDDVPADVAKADLASLAGMSASSGDDNLPEWRSRTVPACAIYMVAPGSVLAEASSINVPVLLAMGERDVVPDPWLEPKAFKSSSDITLFVCPRMAHMHNFGSSREQFWARIHSWGDTVRAQRAYAR